MSANYVLLLLSLLLPLVLTFLMTGKALSLFFREPKSAEWPDFPEYDGLAQRMGVNLPPRRRWGVWRFGGVARTNALRRQVVFDSKGFPKLPPEERLAVAAHELAHLRSRHSLFASLIICFGTLVAFVLALEVSVLLPTVAWFAFFLLMILYRRRAEYQADRIAAMYVPASSLISLLSRFGTPRRRYERIAGGLTHPSTDNRLERLRRLSNVQ